MVRQQIDWPVPRPRTPLGEVEVNERGLISLAKVIPERGRRYLVDADPDGTIHLVPARLVPDVPDLDPDIERRLTGAYDDVDRGRVVPAAELKEWLARHPGGDVDELEAWLDERTRTSVES